MQENALCREFFTCSTKLFNSSEKFWAVFSRAGRSPTFQDADTLLDGLAGTSESNRAGPELSRLEWTPTAESHIGLASTCVPGYPFQH